MSSRKVYTIYKKIVEALQLRQLDVYMVRSEKGTVEDVLRLYSPTTGHVIVVNLGVPRESLSPLEFLERVLKALEENKVPVPERIVRRLRETLEKRESKRAEAEAA
jgi:phage-related baseplate assembly protein